MYFTLFITIALLSWGVSALLDHRFKKYSKVNISLTGRQVAEKMLRDNGITDVQVTCTPGHLTDHYDPRSNTISLSDAVHDVRTAAAVGVAAHEAGHAAQYAENYGPIKLRAAIVPITNIGSNLRCRSFFSDLCFPLNRWRISA